MSLVTITQCLDPRECRNDGVVCLGSTQEMEPSLYNNHGCLASKPTHDCRFLVVGRMDTSRTSITWTVTVNRKDLDDVHVKFTSAS